MRKMIENICVRFRGKRPEWDNIKDILKEKHDGEQE